MNVRMCEQTFGRPNACSHMRAFINACATNACLQALTMLSGTYKRTELHTYTCSYEGKHPSANIEVRILKLEVRS